MESLSLSQVLLLPPWRPSHAGAGDASHEEGGRAGGGGGGHVHRFRGMYQAPDRPLYPPLPIRHTSPQSSPSEAGGGGGLEPKPPKVWVPKTAKRIFPFVKIAFCPTMKSGSGGGGGVGTRPWWLALLTCGSAYWPLAFEPSAMTRRASALLRASVLPGGGGVLDPPPTPPPQHPPQEMLSR